MARVTKKTTITEEPIMPRVDADVAQKLDALPKEREASNTPTHKDLIVIPGIRAEWVANDASGRAYAKALGFVFTKRGDGYLVNESVFDELWEDPDTGEKYLGYDKSLIAIMRRDTWFNDIKKRADAWYDENVEERGPEESILTGAVAEKALGAKLKRE